MLKMWDRWWKLWKPWAILILGANVAFHGYTGSPTLYLPLGLAITALALWIALEKQVQVSKPANGTEADPDAPIFRRIWRAP
jgi:hypothetical protein